MTPEPKAVQLARAVIQAGVGANGLTDAIVSSAHTVVANYEANIEAGRKQAEELQRAIDETARRWPELAKRGFVYTKTEYAHQFEGHRGTVASISNDHDDPDHCLWLKVDAEGAVYENSSVVLALIDAAGKNTTADRLREAMREALECVAGLNMSAEQVLRDALEASNG